jgi:DNA-binding beta-propeller fold protein YncE
MTSIVRKAALLVFWLIPLSLAMCAHQPAPTPLNTGKFITPATQTSFDVGNMPMNLALTPDNKFILASDMGYRQSLWSIRVSDGLGISHVDYNSSAKAGKKKPAPSTQPGGSHTEESVPTVPGSPQSIGLYYGLAIAPNNTIFAAQGAHASIAILSIGDDGTLSPKGSIKTHALDFPAGLALDKNGLLYVANNGSGGNGFEDPRKISGSIAIYNPSKKHELGRCTFSQSYGGTSNFPFGIAVLSNGSKTFVAAERDDAVYAIDTHDPSHPALQTKISTSSHGP